MTNFVSRETAGDVVRAALRLGWPLAICRECATGLGAKGYEGHIATFNIEPCGTCGVETDTCSLRDWSWPEVWSR